MTYRLLIGDCRDSMRALIAEGVKVQMCVTSPPYWGLRDYGVEGQLGLERTISEYVSNMVEVFGLVREMLADDGTLWLNLGDSYAGSWGAQSREHAGKHAPNISALSANQVKAAAIRESGTGSMARTPGLKPKDLCGIPWRVALALQQPQYLGRIKSEVDRAWLAAMIDGEGCMFIHKRKVGQSNGQGYDRKSDSYGAGLEVANTHLAIVERCQQIAGIGSICKQDKDRRQPLYRWNVRSNECRWIVREIYPHLVAKQRQARLLLGCPSSGDEADAAHRGLILLHNGGFTDVDFPAPESLYQPGYYLRQDIIWNKKNPMPESIRDRCTKAHEYLFLMAKSERYLCDMGAIREDRSGDEDAATFRGGCYIGGDTDNGTLGKRAVVGNNRVPGNVNPPKGQLAYEAGDERHRTKAGLLEYAKKQRKQAGWDIGEGAPGTIHRDGREQEVEYTETASFTRNKRSVWTVATQPYSEAHFATYPPALIEPCILAGSKHGDIVLDPFFGSGTTGEVAQRLGREWIGCELNPEYGKLAERRTAGTLGLAFA